MKISLSIATAAVLAGSFAASPPAVAVGGPTDLAPAPTTSPSGPAAPEPTIAPPPLKDSGLEIQPAVQASTKDSITLGWTAPRRQMTLQTSTVKPVRVHEAWQFPGNPVQPVAVTGRPVGGKPTAFSNGQRRFRFEVTINGLMPNTAYYSVARLPLGPGFVPVEQAFKTVTKRDLATDVAARTTRQVSVSVSRLHIQKDGDKGLRGRGEGRFYIRVVPVAQASSNEKWGSGTPVLKFTDGQDLRLKAPIGDWLRTGATRVQVQVQAVEDDVDPGESCFWEGGGWAPSQGSSKCWDTAVAVAEIDLRQTGAQTITARVQRDPAITFRADVDVKVKR